MEDYPALHRYSDDQAQRYEAKRFRHVRGRAVDALEWLLLRRAVVRFERRYGSLHDVLDVPVGTGRMARRLAARGIEVTGLDASEDMLTVARNAHVAQAYQVGRAEDLPFPDRSFDAVVSVRLFGHLPAGAKAEVLQEFGRVARRGAIVFVAGRSRWLSLRRDWRARRGKPSGAWHPVSTTDMRTLAADAGFHVMGTMYLLGPFSETRAVILVPR